MTPVGWERKYLSEIADYKAGRTPARANAAYWTNAADGTPWVAISDMVEFGTVTTTKEKISKEAFEQVFRGQVAPAGTLIMSFKLTIGRIATLGIAACHNEAIISIRPRDGVEQRFLGYYLGQVDYDAMQDRQIKGNTLNQEKLDRIEVFLPPLTEQSAIADILETVRQGIETQNQCLHLTQQLKRTAMRALFTRGLRGEPQKETEIGLVPDSWEIVHVGHYARRISKGSSPKWQGFGYVKEGVLFVRSQNVGDGTMIWHDRVFLPAEWNEKEPRSVLSAGDLLINLVGASIGRCAVGGPEIEGANCNQAVCFVRLNHQEISAEFLNGFLLTPAGQEQIHSSKKDIARANLSLQDVRQILTPKPTINEQAEIAAILDAIDRKIDLHCRKRVALEDLFKTLLHRLMTGGLRVADLDLSALSPSGSEPAAA